MRERKENRDRGDEEGDRVQIESSFPTRKSEEREKGMYTR